MVFALMIVAAALVGYATQVVVAAPYPDRPIRIIVPAAPGSVLDVGVRKLTDRLGRSLGQPVIVENRPGASGFIGAEAVARAKPDGYTILFGGTNIFCINPFIFAKLPYDPVRDFAPVALGARGNPIVLVNPKLPMKTLEEFIAYAKARPSQVTYGSPAVGSPQHITAALLEQLTGIQLVHVPYKNAPQVITDLIGGQIDAAIEYASVAAPHVTAGNVRALVIVGPRRKPVMPDVPTAAEAGLPAFDLAAWNGFVVPAGTPPEIVARLNKELVAALKQRDVVDWVNSLGSEVVASTPEEFASYMKAELGRWSKIVKDAKVEVQ